MEKKKIAKWALAAGISALLFTGPMADVSAAAQSKVLNVSSNSDTSDRMSGGLRYSGRELSYFNYSISEGSTPSSLPGKYDLRDLSKVTPVKDQSPWGGWVFGALSSGESSMLMQGASEMPDLSELQMAWFAYQTQKSGSQKGEGVSVLNDACGILNQGGNALKAVSMLSTWQGAANEGDIPYQNTNGTMDPGGDWSVPEPKRNNSVAHLQNAMFLPASDSPFTNEEYQYSPVTTEAIKKTLMENGVVSISCFAGPSLPDQEPGGTYFNYENWAQYVNEQILEGPDNTIPNHVVSIVGWDDGYSRTNFNENCQPEQDGAWIVKNSWGEAPAGGWGVDGSGYFYLSYYDQSISMPTSFVMDSGADGFKYSNNYQYDYVNMAYTLSFADDSPVYVANVFTSGDSFEQLKAVSAVTEVGNCTVEAKVYKLSENAARPDDGALVATVSDSFQYSGYYTMDLPTPVALPPNTRFSVVQTIRDREGNYRIPFELGETAQSCGMASDGSIVENAIKYSSIINPGESYLYDSISETWKDMADDPIGVQLKGYEPGNVLIKAFTSDVDVTIPVLEKLQIQSYDAMDILIGERQEIAAMTGADFNLPPHTNYVIITPVLSEGSTEAKFEINGRTFGAGEFVSRKLFTPGSELKVTTIPTPAGYADGLVYTFRVKPEDAVIAHDPTGIEIVDSFGYLPQGTSLMVEPVTEGADYEALKKILSEDAKNGKFEALKLITEYAGNPFTLKDGESVTLNFPPPEGYNLEQTQLYRAVIEEDGEAALFATSKDNNAGKAAVFAASKEKNAVLSVNTSYINSYYVLVQKEAVSSTPNETPSGTPSVAGPADPSSRPNNNQNPPSTGDNTPFVVLAVMLGASCAAVVLFRKKNRTGC